jgi:hypothetical protein
VSSDEPSTPAPAAVSAGEATSEQAAQLDAWEDEGGATAGHPACVSEPVRHIDDDVVD